MSDFRVPQFGQKTEQLLAALKQNRKHKTSEQISSDSLPRIGHSTDTPLVAMISSRPILRPSSPSSDRCKTTAQRSAVRRDTEWRNRTDVGIRIDGLPKGVTTLALYRCFKKEGNLCSIQVPDRRFQGPSYVNFCPPPSRAFWAGEGPAIVLQDPDSPSQIKPSCTLTTERRHKVVSPVDSSVEYDESTRLSLDALDFGFMQKRHHYSVMRRVVARRGRGIHLTLNLRFKRLIFEFSLAKEILDDKSLTQRLPGPTIKYRFEVPIRNLSSISQIALGDNERELLFTVNSPPQFYRRTSNVEATHDPLSTGWKEWYTWYRQTDITNNPEDLQRQPVTLRNEHAVIDLGRWTTYRLRLSSANNDKVKFDIFRRALEDHNVPSVPMQNMQCVLGSGNEADIWKLIDPGREAAGTSSLAWFNQEIIGLPFAVRYQLEVCFSRGVLNEHNITKEFLEQLMEKGEQHAAGVLETAALQHNQDEERYYDTAQVLLLKPTRPARKRNDGHFAYMRAAQITPTAVYYSTPILETSNRIIRQFFAYEDRFLRVRFSEEDGKIRSKERDTQEAVYDRIRRAMSNGIRIGDRHYEFLAFGNSQFRENAAYFFAGDQHLRAADIRSWMGDLSDIRTVAKWAARLGQSFSTTRSINSARVKIETELDITRNGYTFSDGVGKISPFLAQLVAAEFGLKIEKDTIPSLFQFRMGGCKGVLVVDPSLAGSRAQEIVIRESQYKFPATHEGLDVIRYSSFAASRLNRQIIILLDTLGVPESIFLEKQKKELAELEKAMHDRDLALRLLQHRIDFNQMTLVVASFLLDGFMDHSEPFVMSVLQLWRAWNIKFLKEKAQITIDQGAFLLGCVDETAQLRGHYATKDGWDDAYGPEYSHSQWLPEIFLQVRDPPNDGSYKVQTGICLLARNPSLHSGDIRIVRAVDVPALHHLKDVVVLPQNGDRDIANMCSGGDLDGDDYMVMWDEDLFPRNRRNWNRPAMDFKPPTGTQLDRAVNIEDVKDFFIKYMKHNRLELIAVSHLAQADQSPYGVDDGKCIALAELHSCAVDYAKSGVPAILDPRLSPKKWPHFMEKDPKKTYRSISVLGRLYDQVQLVDFKPLLEAKPDSRILDAYDWSSEQMIKIMPTIKDIKEEYDKSVRRIMAKHSIGTEFEVWSTFVLSHNRDKGDYKFHEEIGNLAESLKTQYKDEVIDAAGGRDFKRLEPWVAAMYKVTADEIAQAVIECGETKIIGGREKPKRRMTTVDMPLMSFPWIFYSELGKIASGRKDTSAARTLFEVISDQQKTTKKINHMQKAHAIREEQAIPDLEAPSGLVHAGEELKLFQDTSLDLQQPHKKRRKSRQLVPTDWAPAVEVQDHLRRRGEDQSDEDGTIVERLAHAEIEQSRAVKRTEGQPASMHKGEQQLRDPAIVEEANVTMAEDEEDVEDDEMVELSAIDRLLQMQG